MPKFKVQGKNHMTGKKQTLFYDAEDAAQAEKRGWDDGLIVEKVAILKEETHTKQQFSSEDSKDSKQEVESEKAGKSDNVIRIMYMAKSYSTALLLCMFLGGFGAHKFYLEKLPQGFGYIVMFGISIAFPPMLIPLFICWTIDICTMREQVDAFNKQLESKK